MSVDAYRSLISNNPDSIIVLDPYGKVLDINDAGTDMFGYTYNEFMEIAYQDIVILNDEIDFIELFIRTVKGESCTYSASAYHRDGQVIHLQVKNVPMMDHQRLLGVMIVAKDVTELVKTREALHETSERLRSLFESTGDAIDIIDLDGNVLSVNPAFEELYGWKLEEIVGKPMPTIPKERMQHVNKRRMDARIGLNTKGLEVTCLKKDGTSLEVNITLSSLHDVQGNVVAYSGITRDISERKRLEAELRESKNRYASLLHATPEPIFVQRKGIIRYINDSGSQIFGYDKPKDILGRHILDFIHPESIAAETEQLQRSINEPNYPKKNFECKMVRADGTFFIAEGTLLGIEYEGDPAIQVTLRDITERKMMEKALIISEEKYRLIADNMTDLVMIIDEYGFFKYVSPSSLNVLGFTSENLEKKSAINMVYPEDLPDVRQMFNNIFRTQEPIIMEFRVKHGTKKWIWIESKSSFFIDEEFGNPYLLFVAYSIEARKVLEEKLTEMAFHDELTGLPNRRLFHENLKRTLLESKRHQRSFALLFMDIDKFKLINDHFGHAIGDELLKVFSQKVSACLRESDTLSRQGGDEFIVLLPDIKNEESIRLCAERILEDLQQEWPIGEHTFKVTSSIGIAVYPRDGLDIDILMTRADNALYESKVSGRNTYRFFSEERC